MRPIGFSTGAVAYSDFRRALHLLKDLQLACVELSALRIHEVEPLLASISELHLDDYTYISFHAPSSFSELEEVALVRQLQYLPKQWPIILHPDAMHNVALWRKLGSRVMLENMDRRKPTGRTVEELSAFFSELPEANLCFDIGHARQCDTTMTEAYRILRRFSKKLTQVHISEVNTSSQHDRISYFAKVDFQEIANLIPVSVPVIIESRVSPGEITQEICRALEALPPLPVSSFLDTPCMIDPVIASSLRR